MDHAVALNQIASRFQARASIVGNGLTHEIRLDPPADALGLSLLDTVKSLTAVPVPIQVDLAFLGKWVRTLVPDLPADPATEDPIGGMPIVPQILGPLAALTTALPPSSLMMSEAGQGTVAGVPEALGRIKGTIIQTVERIADVTTQLPISVALRCLVTDESSTGASSAPVGAEFSTDDGATWSALAGVFTINSLAGAAAGTLRRLRLRFPVRFSELTTGVPEVMTFKVQLSVQLSVDVPAPPPAPPVHVSTGFIDLPPVPLIVPTIPVPTILVLCESRLFAGRKLVLVPSNSLIGTAAGPTLAAALDLTRTALDLLSPGSALSVFLGTAVPPAGLAAATLKSAAASANQVIVAAHSQVDNLDGAEFVFDPGGWFGIGRVSGHDFARSLICIGRPGTVFDFFNDFNQVESVTRLQVTLDRRLGCALQQLEILDPNLVVGESWFYTAPPRPAEVYG